MDEKLVLRIEWLKKNGEWICSLICRDEAFSQIWLEHGIKLSFNVQPGKYCIGYVTSSSDTSESQEAWKTIEPCPLEERIKRGYQCSFCYRADSIGPCLICDGTKCSAKSSIKKLCQEATGYVYLASFGSSRVKVGVARDTRIPKRWIEQGANLAKRIIVGNGMKIRRFENTIQNTLNVLSGLKTNKKVDTLWNKNIDAEVHDITKVEEEIKKRFPDLPYYQETIHDLSNVYKLPKLDRRPIELKVNKNLKVSGRILGVKGSLLLLNFGDLPYYINLTRLLGRKIELKKHNTMIMQTSLDKF